MKITTTMRDGSVWRRQRMIPFVSEDIVKVLSCSRVEVVLGDSVNNKTWYMQINGFESFIMVSLDGTVVELLDVTTRQVRVRYTRIP